MIDLGSKKVGMTRLRNQNILSDQTLKNTYGKQAFQYFNEDKSSLFVFSDSKSFDLIELEQLLQAVGWGEDLSEG